MTMTAIGNSVVWASLLQAVGLPGSESAGAAANVDGLALAGSQGEAEALLASALRGLGWRMVGAEDTELFSEGCSRHEVDDEMRAAADAAIETGAPQLVAICTWVTSDHRDWG